MGIVQKQSIQSSILQYIGAAIGFVNKILLFTKFLSPEEVGLANIIVTNAMLYAQFSAMGFSTMTLRFFPYFQNKERKHHHFLAWLMIIPAFGFLIVTILILIFQTSIFKYFEKESPMMNTYFWYVVPLAAATLYFDLFDAYLRSLLKTVVPVLFREIIQRIFIAISILLYAIGWIDFPQFVVIYVALISSVTLLMILYTYWLGHLHLLPKRTWRIKQLSKKILVFGGFTLLGNISAIILYNIDGLMLASYMGMDAVGIYTTCFYITALIMIPWRAMQKITSPMVAQHWKDNDLVAMQNLYQRTSLINLGVGVYVYAMMILALPAIFGLMPSDFSAGTNVLIIIGLSRVFDMITGLNTYILIMSKYYRLDLYLSFAVFFVGIVLNLYLIPSYGIEGASLATGLSIAAANLFRSCFLWFKYSLNPFSLRMLLVLLAAGLPFVVAYFPKFSSSPFVQTFVSGALYSLLFAGMVLGLNAIPDSRKYVALLMSKYVRR